MATVTRIDPTNLTLQSYESQDENLISQFDVDTVLTGSSYIEFFVYDNNQTLLYSTTNYTSYNVENDGQSAGNDNQISQFNISPGVDTENQGFSQGEYISYYNFLTKRIGDPNTNLFISEISSDRTEIRLDSNILSDLDIVEQTNNFTQFREDSTYFVDFYLNFGSNDLIISNNIKLSNETTNNPTIVVKLYEPLPTQFDLKDELWVVTTLNEPEAFNVNFPPEPVVFQDSTQISGPNFNLPIKSEVNNSSANLSYSDIISSAPSSSQNQVNSLLEESSINISVDYTDYTDFIHFSSVQTRVENFYYKIDLIEQHSSSISSLSNVTGSSTSTVILEDKISDIIKNFDQFEYFMYYDSGSSASFPKTTSTPPYLLAKATSSAALTWLGSANESSAYFGGTLLSASNYDNANPDELKKAIPEYLREDSDNQLYDLFVDMVAQYYDNVWLYTKDVTQKYNADNRLDFGVSKDLVADAIRDFGVKLYQNNFSSDELYTAFLGLTPNGSLFPFPEITGSLPTPTGFEYVNTLISASNDVIPLDDVNKSLYKRIYHNLPYLLKSKGTIAGLRALITSYGIPDTILRISEFGGKDQVNENDWDYYFNKFNYAWNTKGDNFFRTTWTINTTDFSGFNPAGKNPNTIQLRFKPEQITGSTSPFGLSSVSQSLWYLQNSSDTSGSLVLEYTGSGLSSASYSGATKDPYYQYGTLKYINAAGASASVYLPFFDGGWWSTMITVDADLTASLYAGNKIYNGKDGTSIGYFSSSAAPANGWLKAAGNNSYIAKTGLSGYTNFSGSIQEVRYYVPTISESVFKDYVMNPLSIEGNSLNSSPNELVFRAALGSELDTSTAPTQVSIHPKVTGSWATASSFTGNSNYVFSQTPTYVPNTEYYFLDQFPAGIKNRITDKIRYENNVIPTGDTLSPYRRVAQVTEASASYTDSINYLEVAFSPQNQINDDIIGQLGYFNIGDYIGDPRQRFTGSNYPDLNNLSEDYFEKYIKNYDVVDFVRLIKFFDNSLFKMIKDFIPARTSLASGLVVKQHLLERNKYAQPSVQREEILLTGSIDVGDIEGGPGGVFNKFNGLSTSPVGTLGLGPDNIFNITQSWNETYSSLSGSITQLHDSQAEFYNGEFSGSTMLITNGELNSGCDEFKNISTNDIKYKIRIYAFDDKDSPTHPNYSAPPGTLTGAVSYKFLQGDNEPLPGYISVTKTWRQDGTNTSNNPQIGSTPVELIKISRISSNGVDVSNSLESLTNIIIPFSTGTINYQVITSNEYPSYYLYYVVPPSNGLVPLGPSGSLSNVAINFTGTLDITSAHNIPAALTYNTNGAVPFAFVSGSEVNNFSSSFYSDTNETYIVNTYLQKPINFFFTGSFQVFGSVTVNLKLFYRNQYTGGGKDNNAIVYSQEIGSIGSFAPGIYAGQSAGFTFTNSTPGDMYFIGAQTNTGGTNGSIGFIGDTQLFISSSVSTGSSTSVGMEPYFTSNFDTSLDCQPLLNNTQGERPNPFLQDIDYSTGLVLPTNYLAIQNETATKATVPESMFTVASSLNPSHNSLNTTTEFNINNSLSSQVTGGTFVAYAPHLGTQDEGNGKYLTVALIKYLISPSEEIFEIGSNEENNKLLEIAFATFANPLTDSSGNIINSQFYGNPSGSINTNILLTSGSLPSPSLNPSENSFSSYNGFSLVTSFLNTPALVIAHSGSAPGPITTFQDGGGVIYPASISLTSAKDLPSKALQILSNNRLI